MRSRVWIPIATLLLVGVAVTYWVMRPGARSQARYRTEPVTVGTVSSKVTATGSLQAVTKISVGSEVSGRIEQLFVDFNSRVKKGEVLAQLDPSTFQAQLEQQQANVSDAQAAYDSAAASYQNAATSIRRAEAAILSSQAQVEAARANLANQKASLQAAEANVERARADLDNASRTFHRQEELLKRDLIAQSEVDTARSTYLQARANVQSLENQVEASRATLLAMQASLEARQADVMAARSDRDGAFSQQAAAGAQMRSAQARVRQAMANLEQAQVNLGRTTLRSPIDGIVLDRKVTIGQTVAAQFQAPDLFTLAENLDQMQVEAAVDEADIGQVKVGSRATFTVDAFPEETFEGTVTEVRKAPVTVQNVVTYTVIIRTKNKGLRLMPGMTATVAIQVETRKDVVLVPNAALRFRAPAGPRTAGGERTRTPGGTRSPGGGERRQRGPQVYTLEAGKLVPHPVKTGITDGVNTEILESDLKVGMEVVVEAVGQSPSPSPSNRGGGGRGPRLF